jgi:hypothetical protein
MRDGFGAGRSFDIIVVIGILNVNDFTRSFFRHGGASRDLKLKLVAKVLFQRKQFGQALNFMRTKRFEIK